MAANKSAGETFSSAQLASVLGVKESALGPWVVRSGLRVDPEAMSAQVCAAVGAAVTLSKTPSVKKHMITELFDEVRSADRDPADWLMVKRYRKAPTIEKPPLRIEVTGPKSAKPIIFDPLTMIERLRALPSQ